jgi:hypothetical protein
MGIPLDFSKEKPVTLHALAGASKPEAFASLMIEGARTPRVGDDIEISFDDGSYVCAAVVFLDAYRFPMIELRGKRLTLVPAGRANDVTSGGLGTRWLVTGSRQG